MKIKDLINAPEWLKIAEVINEDVEIDSVGNVVWLGGMWLGGEWLGGEWRGGEWLGGEWLGGEWLGGVWLGGVWRGGEWRGGEWRGGVWRGGVWRGGNFKRAKKSGIFDSAKKDFFFTLLSNKSEVPALAKMIKAGRIEGSQYEGECACLKGTIANIVHCDYHDLHPNSNDPAEIFFLNIHKGDTPETNEFSSLAIEWIDEFLMLTK